MSDWRTHHCNQLSQENIGQKVTLSGWVHRKRNFGSLLFLDLRDHFGITQIIIPEDRTFFSQAENIRQESVVKITGDVQKREGEENSKLSTGQIEVLCETLHIESPSEILPFPVSHNPKQEGEDARLTYRYLDLRTEKMHFNMIFRSQVIAFIRQKMHEMGFQEFTTPILTSSSPEGARDFVVPSRLHPGQFYALPQAPQQFKQLLMCAGFDKYFQIAPCFRDEDPRADRAPGEFYQLDLEMAFVTQDDVFQVTETLLMDLFQNKNFSTKRIIPAQAYNSAFQKSNRKFPCIPWKTAMEKYGSDKPDLRYDLAMHAAETIFQNTEIAFLKEAIADRHHIKAMKIPGAAAQSRKFFDNLQNFAKEAGLQGLPWLALSNQAWKGSLAKVLQDIEKNEIRETFKLEEGDAVIFILGPKNTATLTAGGRIRSTIAQQLNMIPNDSWAFAWIVDFPMYEWNEELQKTDFSHNPFSMPQGGLDALNTQDPLSILAYQYDLVCNGIELSSGAIRNHKCDIMEKAFAIAGYSKEDLKQRFGALWKAFHFGAPPHGGIAPGIDRMIMLLLDEANIREVIAFPLNQKAQDLLMGAPCSLQDQQLHDVHISIVKQDI